MFLQLNLTAEAEAATHTDRRSLTHTHTHTHTHKHTLTSIITRRMVVWDGVSVETVGDIGARRVELSGSSDRNRCQSHPRGPHTDTHRHTHTHTHTHTVIIHPFALLWIHTHAHTDECDLMCCSRCKWTPLFSLMKIYSWPGVDVGLWLCTFTMQGSVHICFPSATRLTFLRQRRGLPGERSSVQFWLDSITSTTVREHSPSGV